VVRTRKWLGLLLAATLAVSAAGCERVSDRSTGHARLLVTRDFGAETLYDRQAADGGSVLDALRGVAKVETGYGGGFINAIDDVRSDTGGKRDWFFYVNGVSPGRGADQQPLRAGDVAWWDYRPWAGLLDAWAVVGSWPEPFVHGYPSAPAVVDADAPLDEPLRRAGATVGTSASSWRVRVGSDAALRARDPAWRRAMADPAAAGLTVRIRDGQVFVLGADGATLRPVDAARAIAAAVPTGATPEAGGVLFAVAGLDAGAARAAAERIARDPGVLRGRFAVAFDGAGEPVAAGGRDGL
jgi:hypothetical protein